MALLELLGQLVDFLGGVGPVLFGIVPLIAAPFVDRLVVRRKRISFRVLYNSKIGIGPEGLSDSSDPAGGEGRSPMSWSTPASSRTPA
ncbi:hypothetical protein ABZ897_58945 [Nonomuraea sp. NPDC046802]|uniref:hypothetical protein n=1 Tax=Nonomuraea sp. NPDC046802 TaxID=3154919 RepID=UPI0033CACCEA